MIYSVSVRDPKRTPIPHWTKANGLRGMESLHFSPGLNIIYGRNGTGKSTLISALAALMHCLDSNWATISKDSVMRFNRPSGIANGLLLEHDGAPARYLGTETMSRTPRTGVRKTEDCIVSTTQKSSGKKMSQGQISTANLVRLLKSEPIRIRQEVSKEKLNPSWVPLLDVATESIKNVKPTKTRRPVFLLDEVDRSLDFVRQAEYWKQIRLLAENNQVIIASHSPFAALASAHFIEMTKGYLSASRKALSVLPRVDNDFTVSSI